MHRERDVWTVVGLIAYSAIVLAALVGTLAFGMVVFYSFNGP